MIEPTYNLDRSRVSLMSVRKNLIWAFFQEYSIFLISLLGTIILSRLLTKDEFGVYALSFMFIVVLVHLRQLGMGTYIVQAKVIEINRARSALGVMYAISWGLGAALVLLRGQISAFFHDVRVGETLLILSISFFLAPLYQYGMALIERRMEFSKIYRISLVSHIMTWAVGIPIAIYGPGHLALPWGYATYSIVSLIMVWMFNPEGNILRPSFKGWKEIIGFGSYISGSGLINTMGMQAPEAILGRLHDTATVGLYNRGSSLISILRNLITNATQRTINVALSEKKRQGHPLDSSYLGGVALSTGLGWSACLILAVVAKPVLILLYTKQFGDTAPFLQFLCLAQIPLFALVAQSEMMSLFNRYRYLFVVEFCMTVFILLNFIFWSRINPIYGAAGRIIDTSIYFVIIIMNIIPMLGIKLKSLGEVYAKSALLAIGSATPVFLIMQLNGWPDSLPFLALAGMGILSLITWMATLFVIHHPLAADAKPVLLSLWKKWRPTA
jgi:O-antigen/teichoic acid export membrane protein